MTELICDADGVRLLPDFVLAERRGAAIVPHHAHEIFRSLAPQFGADLDWARLNFAVGRAARFLTDGRLDAAGKAVESVRLPQPLAKFNPNHYGPGPRGGQFAPTDGDESGYVHPAALDPRKVAALLSALRRLIQRLPPKSPKEPEANPGALPKQGANNYQLPEKAPENGPYRTGRDLADALVRHLMSGEREAGMRLIDLAEKIGWLSPEVPNLITSVLSRIEGPKDLKELIDAVQPGPHPGFHDHHIVEQGPQNDDLSPEDQARIDSRENKVRIPTYAHIEITGTYQTGDPDLGGLTPRQYLRGKSFEERYEFGLRILRKKGLLK